MNEILAMVVRRTGSAIVVLFLVVTFIFFFMRAAGDPVLLLVGERATPEAIARVEARLGLDKPVMVQYGEYLQGIVTGDFGDSSRYRTDAMGLVLDRLPATFTLGGLAIALAVVIAVPVGVLSAFRPGSRGDSVARLVAVIGQSMPIFWAGILLIIVFSVNLGVLPAGGSGTWAHAILPALCLSFYSIPITMRLARSSMIDVLGQDYVRTARAKGLREPIVLVRHALRNAAIPIVTVVALRVGGVVAGTIVIEEVFAYPGLGRLVLGSMLEYDYAVIQAYVFVVASMVVGINLLVDILYGVLDPRVRVA